MARRKPESPGCGRLLDAWVAPSNAGAPVGCLATSYTFDSIFFEEECLARFAGIRSGASDDDRAWEWIIEREERFAQIKAVALVDKDHCRGVRSPRWDLLCARGGNRGGILHAKLSLLVWARAARLIVASANLTLSGYRKNREVFACLGAGEDQPLARTAWKDALDYMDTILALGGEPNHPAVTRARDVIAEARMRVKAVSKSAAEPDVSTQFIGIGPGRSDLFKQVKNHWREAAGPVDDIYAISPFYDPDPKDAARTRDAFWGLARERGEASLSLYAPLTVEPDGNKVLHAPEAWSHTPRESASFYPFGISQLAAGDNERRSLHAKWIWLENTNWALSCSGSANLTAAGMGLSRRPNWEAMLSILVKYDRSKDGYKLMCDAWDSFGGVEADDAQMKGAIPDEEDDLQGGSVNLPDGFKEAIYRIGESGPEIVLVLGEKLPRRWELKIPEGEIFATESAWIESGKPNPWVLSWQGKSVPRGSGFEVQWEGSEGTAWLPVCVLDAKHLPPPEELRNLPLEVLIEVLTTARPLAQTLAAWIKRKQTGHVKQEIALDAHARVDVSSYLIPRIRRVSKALTALKEKLSSPVATEESLRWRLDGPFGARAVVEAIEREAQFPEERVFFTAELCLELSQVNPAKAEGCLAPAKIQNAIREFIDSQSAAVNEMLNEVNPGMRSYAVAAFEKAEKSHADI